MSDDGETSANGSRKRGWLGSFVALFVGVPPIAVWAADEEDAEESAREGRV